MRLRVEIAQRLERHARREHALCFLQPSINLAHGWPELAIDVCAGLVRRDFCLDLVEPLCGRVRRDDHVRKWHRSGRYRRNR
ncbi:MAG TPA: hypothetical protein VG095_02285 [Chthoniobacterales bacterium]|nr:hypothetical protein [Chthoniobacterales bacterium]